MKSVGTYIIPSVLLAVAFHALVIVALSIHWNTKPKIRIAKAERYYIDASLVTQNPYTVRKEEKQRTIANARARQQRLARQRQESELRAKQQAEALEKQRQETLARQRAQQEDQAQLLQQVTKEQEAAKAEAEKKAAISKRQQELDSSLMDEKNARQAVTDDEKAMAYAAQIKRVIIQNWSRPPSARNGMQALLKVRLVPDGEVVDVKVVKSSGNDAFDRSAVLAVQKAQPFDVPSDSRMFEHNFREFEVLFKPEDLRL